MTTPAPVEVYARPVGEDYATPEDRLVIPAAAVHQLEALPFGPDATPDNPITLLPDVHVTVLDLVTLRKVNVRRALAHPGWAGHRPCGWEYWPVTRTEPVPPPDVQDDWEFYAEDDSDG